MAHFSKFNFFSSTGQISAARIKGIKAKVHKTKIAQKVEFLSKFSKNYYI